MHTDSDYRLANLIADLTEQQKRGEAPDIDRAARENPDLASELRELWATAQFAAAFVPLKATIPEAPATMSAPPDAIGDYEILEELGRGGMGVVYKARQRSLGRLVAIKMMRETRLSSPMDRARFRSEAEASAKLKHPNLVTVYEVGEHGGMPYIVMEYVDGRTLTHRLAEGPVASREAARLLAEIARAVDHAHTRGILHRDLKPSNVLITHEGSPSGDSSMALTSEEQTRVKVADFGLAKRLTVTANSTADWKTQTGAIVGTPGYMAPEQATGRRDLTPATDVYALGAILYECLTGRPPFQATNVVDALFMVVEQEVVPPRMLTTGIDRDLELICLKCLQKPPELRYDTAGQLASDLENFLKGEALTAQQSGFVYLFSRMMRETHHIGVLENWGLLWIWHSLATFILCLLTQIMEWVGIHSHIWYLTLWTVGLITWGMILWGLRRRAGPVLFVERQIAHAWGAGVCASIAMFVVEVLIDRPVLELSPAIAIAAGMVFVFKAGILTGRFYLSAMLMFAVAMVMPIVPQLHILIFGIALAGSFLVPGIKFYRIRKQSERVALNG